MRQPARKNPYRAIIGLILLLAVLATPLSIIIPRWSFYTVPYYTETVFKEFEHQFNTSQYRKKVNPGIMPDESLFSYVSGAYLRGMDPILANSEHTPLGKYFIALSIYLLHNDRFTAIVFALLSGISIWLVGRLVLKDSIWALAPVLLVTIDRLFMNQLVTVPLLDIIQFPFIFLSLFAFYKEHAHGKYFWTSLMLGAVIATKTVVPGILLVGCMGVWLVIYRGWRSLIPYIAWLPLSACVFMLSYIRTFMDGYSLWQFVGFQKWIFLYQKSKLLYPFSSLRLLFFNQWQTWWGDFSVISANDWSLLWPVSTAGSIGLGIWTIIRKQWKKSEYEPLVLLLLWIGIYQAFLCFGVVSSRFFIPLLPAQYIVLTYILRIVLSKNKNTKRLLVCIVSMAWLVFPHVVRAEYVLPYPSYMPGNKLYSVSRILDKVKAYWYWGNIGKFRYHLGLSDKNLVEAKTLMEYRQYLLGVAALKRSDTEFEKISGYLSLAKHEGIDIGVLKRTALEASEAHTSVITRLVAETPVSFIWTPEKVSPSELQLHTLLNDSLRIREKVATKTASL